MLSDARKSMEDAVMDLRDAFSTIVREHFWTFHVSALTAAAAAAYVMHRRAKRCPPGLSQGSFVEPGFEEVQKVFEENLRSGLDRGGSFAAYYKGKLVVNLFGGYSDEEAGTTWKQDTVSINFSATKFTNALVAALLIDRGLMSLDDPVVKYWPEFGQHGKDKVTIGQVLSHRAGCPYVNEKWSVSYIVDDLDKFGDILARQKPIVEPGTDVAYHLVTVSHYFDQIVRRVDPQGRTSSEIFRDEIAKPLDLNYAIGLPLAEQYKAARVYLNYMKGWNAVPPKEYFVFAFREKRGLQAWSKFQSVDWSFNRVNDPDFRKIPDASIQGYTSALSAAKMCANLAAKSPEPRLFSEKSIKVMGTPLTPAGVRDAVFHSKIRWGPGSFVVECKCGDEHFNIFGGLSYGGPMHVVDPRFEMGFAYVTNYLNPYSVMVVDPRYKRVKNALYNCVRKLEGIKDPIEGEFLAGPLRQ